MCDIKDNLLFKNNCSKNKNLTPQMNAGAAVAFVINYNPYPFKEGYIYGSVRLGSFSLYIARLKACL